MSNREGNPAALSCWTSAIHRSGPFVVVIRGADSLQSKFAKLFANLPTAQCGSSWTGDYDNVDPLLEIPSKMPKPLANPPFYPISDDCTAQLPARSHT
jgi:hypothetical protein